MEIRAKIYEDDKYRLYSQLSDDWSKTIIKICTAISAVAGFVAILLEVIGL
jgi:hypothetical protein